MSQGDISSWNVAGGYQSRGRSTHLYKFGLSYSAQDYLGGNPAALAAATDGSRNVGEVYAVDRWALTSRLSASSTAAATAATTISRRAASSARAPASSSSRSKQKKTRVSAFVAQRMVAPGAEEFVASETPGPWLPPERTFAPLGGLGRANTFSVERARYLDLLARARFRRRRTSIACAASIRTSTTSS